MSDAERRARLGRRHALATEHRVETVDDAARAVVALHGTDPATTVLSALARTRDASPADVEYALYDDRSLVRVLSMRRTVFAVAREVANTCLAGASDVVAAEQRRLLRKALAEAGITGDLDAWVTRAELAALTAIAAAGEATSTEISEADPLLATRVQIGSGKFVATPTVASRLMTLLSAEGSVVRTKPRGTWTSTQFRWATMASWCDLGERPDATTAATELARLWFGAYGPATLDDLQWWTGWTKTRTRAAVAPLEIVEVELEGRPGLVLADDVDPVEAPDPWVALLPALDPSAMGWKHRDFVLGPHRERLFDINGNAGPTVWADGRIVGGWAQLDDGTVAFSLLQDIGTEATAAVEQAAADLTTTLGDVRLKARARGWTIVEKDLRA
ncbi:winged helix DNA-binding domain-containing protein [Aeromicrobium ginsengisoli]|uniref:Winged helix DNA-binding domain-containing protein n=1 Tax=Aeromicrobium ginsengisoli TaxID=363867 RepID=A0A5M4FHC4_9ACTN|nr:winged helix DNA-binding domain-containing protein [Aeromicrobium ginsengisoli]